jgi:hypothetical protein
LLNAYIGSENNIGCACEILDIVNGTIMYLFSTKKFKINVKELYLRLVVSRRTADGGKNLPVGEFTPVYW